VVSALHRVLSGLLEGALVAAPSLMVASALAPLLSLIPRQVVANMLKYSCGLGVN